MAVYYTSRNRRGESLRNRVARVEHLESRAMLSGDGVFGLSSLLADNGKDGTDGFVLNRINVADLSGYSVSGDVNGDGYEDVVIGATIE